MTVEMLFDGYESRGNLSNIVGNSGDGSRSRNAQPAILQNLFNVRGERKPLEDWRAHFCVVMGQWRNPSFTCGIESLQTKYQAFTTTGQMLCATCTVALKEAGRFTGGLRRATR